MVSVAQRFLADVDLPSPELRENISHHMAEVHISVTIESEKFRARCGRINYVTPKSFLALIEFYSLLLNEKKEEVKTSKASILFDVDDNNTVEEKPPPKK